MNKIEKLRKDFLNTGIDAILITGEANRRYISNFTGSNGYIIISNSGAFFITDSRYTNQAKEECIGFEVIEYGNLIEIMKDVFRKEGVKRVGVEEDILTYSQLEFFKNSINFIDFVSSKNCVEKLREVKDSAELENMRIAAEIGDRAFKYILDYIKPGVTEQDIAIELEYFMKKNGASNVSFDTIVASGKRTAMPHAHPTNVKINERDIVLMDYGCIYNGYCSDMTRTIFVGKPLEEYIEVYNIVFEAQCRAIKTVKAGVTGKYVDSVARDYIFDKGYGKNFGHGLGHSVGLEIHEKPTFSPVEESIIQNNMVITVEPGIYVNNLCGVRIEDTVIVGNNGCEILTNSSKDIIIL